MSLLLKECRWCGNRFVPAHFNDAYCSDKCRDDGTKDKQKKGYLPSYYRKTKELEWGVPTIFDVICATIEHKQKTGRLISYGKMVAIMEKEGF